MNDKDFIKKKTDLMKSIMGDRKLSQAFREAMVAPIGSTKREHIKSTLSIMKKLSGLKYDGVGGTIPTSPSSSSVPSTPNYSNMVIFPALPKFKVKQQPPVKKMLTPNSFDGSGGTYDGRGGILDDLNKKDFSNLGLNFKLPNSNKVTNTGFNIFGNQPTQSSTKSYSNILNMTSPSSTNKYNLNLNLPTQTSKTGLNVGGTPETAKTQISIPSTTKNIPPTTETNSQSVENALTPGQFNTQTKDDTTSSIQNTQTPITPSTKNQITETQTSSNNISSALSKNPLISSAQSAVNQGTGAGLFAMNVADEKFGGSLSQYIANLDEKLKKDFNLEPLEVELSNLKSMKSNLIPTLTQYVQGKDKYLKFIDEMINKTEDNLLGVDMSDPSSVEDYNRQINYLYTLKGRQNQRYGNYLNSAISDYEADLERTQSNYDNVLQHYSDAITRQGTIAQNEYNTLYTTMSDLYNNLEQAPIKRANLEALQLQNQVNSLSLLNNGLNGGIDFNWDNVKKYVDMISDKDGNIDLTKIPSGGLVDLYKLNVNSQGTEGELTEAIRRTLAKTLETSTNPATVAKVRTLINDLANNPDPAGAIYAGPINNSIAPVASKLLSTYILGNLDSIKSATKNLVKGGSGFLWTGLGADKPGIQDKETWLKNNSSIDKDFLGNLYDAISINVGKGTAYESSPSDIINRIFTGTDEQSADNLANIITVSS